MGKRLAAAGLCALLFFACPWAAGESAVGGLSAERERTARESGLEIHTKTQLSFGGLPLWDDETNAAVGSLLSELTLEKREQGAAGSGYVSLNAYLQKESVFDLTLLSKGGVYYEQSNLLGGRTAACTKDEFSVFAARVAEQSGGALPKNLAWLYELISLALLGGDGSALDTSMIDRALAAYEGWAAGALTVTERRRPDTWIPGIYGATARVAEVTQEEALALFQAFDWALSGGEALWPDAASARPPEGSPTGLFEAFAGARDLLRAIAQTLPASLPRDLPASEYRMVYGLDGTMVSRQLAIALPEGGSLLFEWSAAAEGVPALYVAVSFADSAFTLLCTAEQGVPVTSGGMARKSDAVIAQASYTKGASRADMMMTIRRSAERRKDVETVDTEIECTLESETWLGEGALLTLSASINDKASGAGEAYALKRQTVFRLKGMGFDGRDVLTVTETTGARKAQASVVDEAGAVHPALMDDAAFAKWMEAAQESLLQAAYTALGRVPPDVARYLLRYF